MADEKDWPSGWDVVRIPFCFVPHGAPEPTEWMARHPGWFKIPATFIPRGNWPPVPEEAESARGMRVADHSEDQPRRRLPSEFHTSRRGKDFIFLKEAANPEITKHTHWPGAQSGVTLGPGYDMAFRTPEQIVFDLMSIGVDYEHARVLATAGIPPDGSSRFGLQGPSAKAFAERHAKDVTLTLAQQQALLEQTLPAYEAEVRRLIHVPLTQNQFDALVSFDYNEGVTGLSIIAKALNKGDYEGAARTLEHFDDKGPPGVRMRRYAEAAKFRFNAPGGQ
ncbi:MAG: glycoside hydrolase family protein [Acetobacteraceae bacterium]|nr:glycoside hydrolase family protein [Acetobacteraceae bacterium]